MDNPAILLQSWFRVREATIKQLFDLETNGINTDEKKNNQKMLKYIITTIDINIGEIYKNTH
jgi:hypothetical protein